MHYKVIAVDCGKENLKVVVLKNGIVVARKCLPSAIGYADDGQIDMMENLHTFFCNTLDDDVKSVKIGSYELPIKPDDSTSKNALINRILTLFALGWMAAPGDELFVPLGCPTSNFKDKEGRKVYLENIVPAGEISCEIDGIHKEFTVKQRLVCAEGTGFLSLHPEYFHQKNHNAIIYDCGGLNSNICTIHNGSIVAEYSNTSIAGGRMLQLRVRRMLRDNDMNIPDNQILDVIQAGYVDYRDPKMREKSKELIEEAVNSFINEIEQNLKSTFSDIRNLDIFFIGGTSYLLKDYLAERFKGQAHFEKSYEASIYANAEGFARKMFKMLQK